MEPEKRWLCTDCNDTFREPYMRKGMRCPMCGGARTIEVFSRTSQTVGNVAVNITFGRLPR